MGQFLVVSLGYTTDLHSQYQKFSDLPGFVLLQSSDTTNGRYDILSAYPYDRISLLATDEDISHKLTQLMEIGLEESVCDLPFQGGAIGYIAYDLACKIQGLPTNAQAVLRDVPLLDLGIYDWAIITDHQLKTITLFAANRHKKTQEITQEIQQLWQQETTVRANFEILSDFIPQMSKDKYQHSFDAIHEAIESGRCYQVNLTQSYQAEFRGDSWSIYYQVSQRNPVPYSAFIRTPIVDILSFSPERFILKDKDELMTAPIKGTIKRSTNKAEDNKLKAQLETCDKNRAENIMIVDLLRNDFGKIAKPGSVKVDKLCEVQSFHSVHHLVSTIYAQCLDGIKPFDAFLSCFPGGSITGAPKIEAMKIINEEEPASRGVYCGSIGYFSAHGRFDTNIAIRTITAKEGILHLAAGGGIVMDSQCEDEYLECLTKIAAIVNGLA